MSFRPPSVDESIEMASSIAPLGVVAGTVAAGATSGGVVCAAAGAACGGAASAAAGAASGGAVCAAAGAALTTGPGARAGRFDIPGRRSRQNTQPMLTQHVRVAPCHDGCHRACNGQDESRVYTWLRRDAAKEELAFRPRGRWPRWMLFLGRSARSCNPQHYRQNGPPSGLHACRRPAARAAYSSLLLSSNAAPTGKTTSSMRRTWGRIGTKPFD